MKGQIIGTLVFLGLPFLANAGMEDQLKSCSLVSDSLARLACFDKIAASNMDTSSVEGKQVKACVDDIKLGLNDPDSFQLTSSRGFPLDNGGFRQEIKYTAKNSFGGRVRGETICGFASPTSTTLHPEDLMNRNRKLARDLRELGITR